MLQSSSSHCVMDKPQFEFEFSVSALYNNTYNNQASQTSRIWLICKPAGFKHPEFSSFANQLDSNIQNLAHLVKSKLDPLSSWIPNDWLYEAETENSNSNWDGIHVSFEFFLNKLCERRKDYHCAKRIIRAFSKCVHWIPVISVNLITVFDMQKNNRSTDFSSSVSTDFSVS